MRQDVLESPEFRRHLSLYRPMAAGNSSRFSDPSGSPKPDFHPEDDPDSRSIGVTMQIQQDKIAKLVPSIAAIRQDIHAHPELAYNEHRTAALVAEELRSLGLEVVTGIDGTGVVGTLRRGNSGGAIGFRADMDALAIEEGGTLPYSSTISGVFHGCGHDGHTAMLLGAARHLAQDGQFSGNIHFIFQLAEEGLGGAKEMINDGLFERFPCEQVFALHNWPDLPAGTIQTRPGPIMAAGDNRREQHRIDRQSRLQSHSFNFGFDLEDDRGEPANRTFQAVRLQ